MLCCFFFLFEKTYFKKKRKKEERKEKKNVSCISSIQYLNTSVVYRQSVKQQSMNIECGQILGLQYPVDCTDNWPDQARLQAAVREDELALILPEGEDQRPDPGDGGKRASGLINPFQVSDVSGVGFQRISP